MLSRAPTFLPCAGATPGGKGGLLAELGMNAVTLLSDSRRKASSEWSDGWQKSRTDDRNWAPAAECGVAQKPSIRSAAQPLNVEKVDIVYFNGVRIGSDRSWRKASPMH